MEISPIAVFRAPFKEKFGIPRQSGLAAHAEGWIVFEPEFRNQECIRGLEAFSHLWLLWGFSANRHKARGTTVRPPLLGGNQRMGVFATRSPYRPNPIGLSSVKLTQIDTGSADGPRLCVAGADLMDGTPIYDIKPYLPFTDSHPEARGGFTDTHPWNSLHVEWPEQLLNTFSEEQVQTLTEVLSLDPRPHYHDDPNKIYSMRFDDFDVRFRVDNGTVIPIERTERD